MTKEEFEKALGEVVAYEIDTGEYGGPLEALKKNITTEVMELVVSVFGLPSIAEFPKWMRDDYEKLIARVECVDVDAAKYLQNEATKLPMFKPDERLSACFTWSKTPQGFKYWDDIDDKITISN